MIRSLSSHIVSWAYKFICALIYITSPLFLSVFASPVPTPCQLPASWCLKFHVPSSYARFYVSLILLLKPIYYQQFYHPMWLGLMFILVILSFKNLTSKPSLRSLSLCLQQGLAAGSPSLLFTPIFPQVAPTVLASYANPHESPAPLHEAIIFPSHADLPDPYSHARTPVSLFLYTDWLHP